MIEKFLHKLGYLHKSELTEEFLCLELGKFVGDPTDNTIEKEQEEEVFRDLARIDGFKNYLKNTMARDMQRDFGATPDQRQMIHGAFARTAYMKGKILEVNKSLLK